MRATRKWAFISAGGASGFAIGLAWFAVWRHQAMRGNLPDFLLYEMRPPLVMRLVTIAGFWVMVIGIVGLMVTLIRQRRADRH